jgi:TrmH family RNA methyltransferase
LAEEALAAGWEAHLLLYTQDLSLRGLEIVDEFAAQGAQVELVSPDVLRAVSDTVTPQGILIALTISTLPYPHTLDFAFIPDAVRDPGNLGTMLRTAAAAGVGAVFLPPGTVDLFAPKVVRAAMGAHFRVPVYPLTWQEIHNHLNAYALRVYLAAAGVGEAYTQVDFRSPLALIIGGEAEGAGQEARQWASGHVHIPMSGNVESLNAAIAAAILMFEVARQRSAL